MWTSFFPILLLVSACLGVGGLMLHLGRDALPYFPPWLHAAVAYFLGQGIIAAVLMLVALAGLFSSPVLLSLLLLSSIPLVWLLWRSRFDSKDCLRGAWSEFRTAPAGWKLIALMAAGLYLYGFGSLGGMIAGDAAAFYLAISKTTAYAQELLPLPGYDGFSLFVGLFAEVLVAALIGLGVPYQWTTIFSWFNYLPTLILAWGLAWAVGLCRRGRLLTVCIALTSSAAVLLWGDGKTDLFAAGPAFAACLLALAAWNAQTYKGAALLAGFFCGLAVVLKLSLMVVLLPAVLFLLTWPSLFDLVKSINQRRGAQVLQIAAQSSKSLGVFGIGLALAVLPHVAKNLWLGGTAFPLGSTSAAYYSPETTWRIVMSYPLALTYGRYWAQYGNLSPLVIAFFPLLLFLPRPKSWRGSRLTALTLSTLVGLLAWIVFVPSIFMPRYILASLLMLGVPAAAGAAYFSRKGALTASVVLIATAVTLYYIPAQVSSWHPAINWPAAKRLLTAPPDECVRAGLMTGYCEAHQVINAAVEDASPAQRRVLVFSWYRLWLHPDILGNANSVDETLEIDRAEAPWELLRRKGFGFVFLDTGFTWTEGLMDRIAPAVELRELYRAGNLTAYQILN